MAVYHVIHDQSMATYPIPRGSTWPAPGDLPYTFWRAAAFEAVAPANASRTIVATHTTERAARQDAARRNKIFSTERHAQAVAVLGI